MFIIIINGYSCWTPVLVFCDTLHEMLQQDKINDLQGKIDELKPEIVGISEVWMKEDFIVQVYYPAFRRDREERKKGGGVLLLVKNCHAVVKCTDLNSDKFEESVWCI